MCLIYTAESGHHLIQPGYSFSPFIKCCNKFHQHFILKSDPLNVPNLNQRFHSFWLLWPVFITIEYFAVHQLHKSDTSASKHIIHFDSLYNYILVSHHTNTKMGYSWHYFTLHSWQKPIIGPSLWQSG